MSLSFTLPYIYCLRLRKTSSFCRKKIYMSNILVTLRLTQIIVIRNVKIVWKHGPHVAEFWYYLEILGVARVTLHQFFFKIASTSWFWCCLNYNWLFYMLDKDNIISASISEAVENNPIDEIDDRKCSVMCFTLHSHSIQRADQHIANIEIVVYLLIWTQCS